MASSKDKEPQDATSNGEGNTENEDKVEDNEQDGKNNDSKDASSPGKIFIGGLSRDTTSETFTSHFGKYGELTDSVIMKDRHTGQPRGFGFVTYADPSVVDKVIKDKHVLNGKTVEIKRTIPRGNPASKGPKTKKIFVGGIPISTTEDELKDYFAKYGKIVEHQIMQDRDTGRSRGFGFVTFDSEQAVEDVLAQGKLHELGGKQVEIKKAEPKKPLPEAGPAYGVDTRGPYIAGGGGPYRDSYSGLAGGYIGNVHRSVGGYGGRDGGYGGYGAAEFGRGYGGYGGSSLGGYGEDSSRGYGSRIGSYGGYGSGPFGSGGGAGMLGGYGGIGGGYGAYGGSSYGSGFDSGIGGGYGGGGTYGSSRGGYGSSSDGRYHPYAR